MSRTRRLWALGLTIAVLGATCTTSATRGDDGSIVESGSLSVFSMAAGDCFDDPSGLGPDGMEIGSVGAVPCAEPHDNEAFAVYQIPGGPDAPYPGDQQIYVSARGGCVDRFAGYVGVSYDDSRLDVDPITPTRQSWSEESDREVVCFLYDLFLEPLEGSMQGARE